MYHDVPESYKEHIVFCNERGINHQMSYEIYLDLQYESIKTGFGFVSRVHKVWYLRV